MVTTPLMPTTEFIYLSGISWRTYETLLDELSDRHFRLTYHCGYPEIMVLSPEHELMRHDLERACQNVRKDWLV
jgi:Uma2 family endonuclease